MLLKYKEKIFIVCLICLFIFALSCGGGSNNGNNPQSGSQDKAPPTVSSTSPLNNGKNVSVNSAITATFSKEMDAATITTSTFYLGSGVPGVITFNGLAATFTPSSILAYNKKYTVTIKATVKDISGNRMVNNFVWEFTTEKELLVLSTTPENMATNVSINSNVIATFNEAIDTSTINTNTFTIVGAGLAPAQIESIVTSSGTTATFTPFGAFAYNTEYTAKITTEVKDLAGKAMKNNYIWKFTTEYEPFAPNFTLTDINSNKISLSDFSGKVIILDFWATWCGPCRYEIPNFVALYNQYKDQGLVIIGVDVDSSENASVLKPFAATYGITYPLLLGTAAVEKLYGGIKYIPTTFIIDRNNIIIKKFIGSEDKNVFEDEIKKLL